MTTRIFPYPTMVGALDLTLPYAEAKIGGGYAEISRILDHRSRTLDLTGDDYAGASEARLDLSIEIPKSEYERLEPLSRPLSVVVVSHCAGTNSRTAVAATKSEIDSTNWGQKLVLNRNQFRGAVQIKALLIGRAGGRDYRLLGESEPWLVYFDENSSSVLRGTLPVKWIDFGSDEVRPFLKPYANEAWYADLTEAQPTVYLNKSFEYLPELFRDGVRRSKAQVALNEAQRTAIAKSIWMAMFQAAAAQITPGDDDSDPSWPDGWRAEVLRRILPRIYPDLDENEGLRLAHEALKSDAADQLESSALAVIGRDIVKEGKNLRKALNAVMAPEEE